MDQPHLLVAAVRFLQTVIQAVQRRLILVSVLHQWHQQQRVQPLILVHATQQASEAVSSIRMTTRSYTDFCGTHIFYEVK